MITDAPIMSTWVSVIAVRRVAAIWFVIIFALEVDVFATTVIATVESAGIIIVA